MQSQPELIDVNTLHLHIEYLLRSHDCVIVPGLGAFIINRHGARLDREAGVIEPPTAELTFNPSVRHNDGLLASSIARREEVEYDTAAEILAEELAAMRSHLATERKITIGMLGTLSLGAEDNLVFTPTQQQADRFGLHRILLPRIAPNVDAANVSVAQPEAEAVTAEAPQRKWRTDKYYYLPIHKGLAKIAAIIVLVVVIAAGLFTFTPEINNTPRRDCASVIPVNIEAPVAKPQPAVKAEPEDTAARYHVVVGTFTTQEEVSRFVKRHADDGYELKAIAGPRLIRVTAARSNDRGEMVSVLRSAAIDSCFNGAWIWEN